MISKLQLNLLTALGGLALLLAIGNGTLFAMNRSMQANLADRQQFVQQTIPLQTLYRDIVKTLADLAVKSNDRQVLEMLAAQGLSVSVNPGTTSTSAPAANAKATP